MNIDYTELEKSIETELLDMGFELLATLVRDDFDPYTREGLSGQSHWAVTIKFNGGYYTTEYHMGAAHRHIGTGKRRKKVQIPGPYTRVSLDMSDRLAKSVPNKPTLTDVMYCLISDSQTFHYGCLDFEEWAQEYGYDTDSREAERMYNACRACYVALKRMGVDFDRLCELFQDY